MIAAASFIPGQTVFIVWPSVGAIGKWCAGEIIEAVVSELTPRGFRAKATDGEPVEVCERGFDSVFAEKNKARVALARRRGELK